MDSGLTKQHVIDNWVSEAMSLRDARGRVGSAVIEGPTRNEVNFARDGREHAQRPLQAVVRILCPDCNNRWLSPFEERAKGVLGPMLAGKERRLTSEDQELLAFWAIKVALMQQQVHPSRRPMPDSAYRALRELGRPADSQMVWLGHRAEALPSWALFLISPVAGLRLGAGATQEGVSGWLEAHSIYRVTMAVGPVVFQIFGHDLPTEIRLHLPGGDDEGMLQIWPPRPVQHWPPPLSIEARGGLADLHRRLGGE